MNDYVSGWSVQFPITDAQYLWLDSFVDVLNDSLGCMTGEVRAKLIEQYPRFDLDAVEMDYALTLEHTDGQAVLYNEEFDGGVDQAAHIVQAFIQHFQLPLRVGFMFASTDRNEVWGGCVHITKHEILYKNLGDMLDEMLKANEIDWQNNPQIPT